MTNNAKPANGLGMDLAAMRRYLWLPIASVVLAVAIALIIGAMRPGSGDARFRVNVAVDALPPLFGPALTPSPFDYATLATSDAVVADVAERIGRAPQDLKPRLQAEARFNSPEIDLSVTGGGALGVARAWEQAFAASAADQTPALERLLAQPYTRQLDQARAQVLREAAAVAAAVAAASDDPVAQQEFKAAQENYETAARLAQSYEVVASTMTAHALTVVAPHARGAALASAPGRLGAAIAIGLLAGVIGALALDYTARRRVAKTGSEDEAPPALRRRAGPAARWR